MAKSAGSELPYFAIEATHRTGKRATETQTRRQFDTSEEKVLHGHNNSDTSASIPQHNEHPFIIDLSGLTKFISHTLSPFK